MADATTILFIDDEADIRTVTRTLLERAGYRVLSAARGEVGLMLARTERPAAILLDILMPKMDGREVLRQLKADPATAAIPVIILTGIEEDDPMADPMESGAAHYLVKPYQPEDLLNSLRRVLSNGHGAPPPDPT